MSITKKDYISRINIVLQHIDQNLDTDLSLEKIAIIANFSPFHFHRVFSEIVGETTSNYINRKRIERIASLLLNGSEIAITILAETYGFKSVSSFSRAFKKFYGISPKVFKENSKEEFSKIGKVISKNGQEYITFEKYICNITNIKNWTVMNTEIKVQEMPKLDLAYVKHVGAFNKIGDAYNKLFKWAIPNGLLGASKTITLYHDNPKVTPIAKVRQSACITISADIKVTGEINKTTIKKDKFAVGRFEINDVDFSKAWDSMFVWIAENGYFSKDGDYYEIYHNNYMEHPQKKFILDICIPVE